MTLILAVLYSDVCELEMSLIQISLGGYTLGREKALAFLSQTMIGDINWIQIMAKIGDRKPNNPQFPELRLSDLAFSEHTKIPVMRKPIWIIINTAGSIFLYLMRLAF